MLELNDLSVENRKKKWNIVGDKKPVRFYRFVDCSTDSTLYMSEASMRANVFYPFAGYSGSIVGHTHDNFFVVNLFSPSWYDFHYTGIKDELEYAYQQMGKHAWMSPNVKRMNVATTRVTKGHRTVVYDIPAKGADFWRSDYHSTAHHISGEEDQVDKLLECRKSACKASAMYSTKRANKRKCY